jgi:DMSO/TMAO reductase YedYZ molybdopterin-dependent catalytic subunit
MRVLPAGVVIGPGLPSATMALMRSAGGGGEPASSYGERLPAQPRLPPGQEARAAWPVLHYGPVPKFKPETWDFRIFGATRDGDLRWDYAQFCDLPQVTLLADFHCVTKFSVLGIEWSGVSTATVLAAAPPADGVTHVMVWAEYGFSANMRIEDFAAGDSLFATGRDGSPLSPEHGFPVRLIVPRLYAWKGPKWVRGVEYLTEDRRGFWEERGYHNVGAVWEEQRYSYQEQPGDGPEY